jgi:hypothetical protein
MQRRKVQCPTCKKDLSIGYIKRHLRDVHGSSALWVATPLTEVCHRTQADHSVSSPPYCKSVECPVEGCPYRTCSREHICLHFMWKHPLNTIVILDEGPLSRCEACNMFVTHYALKNGHRNSEQCVRGAEAKKK